MVDLLSEIVRHHHRDESGLQKSIRRAARLAGIAKSVSSHTFRYCYATRLLEAGYDIRTVQELLGHKDVRTIVIHTYVLKRGVKAVRNPLNELVETHTFAHRKSGQSQ